MSARQTRRIGHGVFGTPFMRFTLHYDGSLPSSGNKAQVQAKWDIRKRFDPQLRELWKTHPALLRVEDDKHYPRRVVRCWFRPTTSIPAR
ncbi:MAG TPA: hypothetical protein VGN61_13405 [Verrucomicrobiae bacterium]